MRSAAWPFAIVAVFALAMLYAANWIRNEEAAFRIAEVERTLRAAASHADQTLALADTILQNALTALRGRNPDTLEAAELAEIERGAVGSLTQVMRLHLYGPGGTSKLLGAAVNVADRDYFAAQTDTGRTLPERAKLADARSDLVIGAPVLGRQNDSWVISVSRPILSADGRTAGVAAVGVPLEIFNNLYLALLANPSDFFALWRTDGTMLVRAPGGPPVRGQPIPDAPIWAHDPNARSGSFVAPVHADGKSRTIVFQGLAPMPLVLAYAIEERGLTWAALMRYWPLIAVAMAALAAAFAFAWRSLDATLALRRSNADLRAAEAHARSAADARGAFIANMNHELRTPLNAVIGFSQMISGQVLGPIGNARYGEYARDIEMSGAHLLALIDDIIDFSAIDSGHRPLEVTPIDVASSVGDALKIMRPLAEARRIDFAIDLAAGSIAGDARAVRQILVNVMSNAIKFSPPGSHVRISGQATLKSRFYDIAVVDEGRGFDSEDLARVGQVFFRTQQTRTQAIAGSGLGLSIARRLAEMMGGAIQIANAADHGAEIRLRMPAAA
jgi:two-component system, cell cycle sensor histidine kinase PleC